MKRYLDASVVVRHLTGNPADQAARARTLLASSDTFWVTETCLLETAYVLERLLGKPRADVVDALITFLREPNVSMQGLDQAIVLRALLYCRPSRRVSFGDALLWAAAYQDAGEIFTFDGRFPAEGVTVSKP